MNFDAAPAGGFAWLVAKGPSTPGTPYRGGAIYSRRIQWNVAGTAELVDAAWQVVSEPSPTYRDYFDLDDGLVKAPQLGDGPGGPRLDLQITGSRLMNAVIRDGILWTCQHVGLTGVAGAYASSDPTGAAVDRAGAQWLKFQIGVDGQSLNYVAHGRVYDDCAENTSPYWYYFPSVMVNAAGDLAMGFSGSSAESFIGAYSWWQLADGTKADRPGLLKAGQAHYADLRWGDYSATTLDPTDGISFWTVQQFAKDAGLDLWGTWIARLRIGP